MENIEVLINNLINGTKDEKEKSVLEITKIGLHAVDYLLPLLSHVDYSVRRTAASILCDIGDKSLIHHLVEFLKEKDDELRKKAIEAIANIKDPETIDILIELFEDSNVNIRLSAIDALIKMGSPAIEKLICALESPIETIRESAAFALGRIKNIDTIPKLINLLSDKSIYVRMAAARALSNMGENTIKTLLDLLKDRNEAVRESASYALGEIKDKDAVPYIIDLLTDKNPFVKISVIQALGKIGDKRAIEPLSRLLKHKDIFVRMAISQALGKIGSEEVIEPLLALISDENVFVSISGRNAIVELCKKDINVFHHLLNYLTNNNPEFRKSAAQVLGKAGNEGAIVPLILSIWDENEEVTVSVEEALNSIDPYWFTRDEIRQYIPYFSEALKKGYKHVKLCIIRILSRIGELGIEIDEIASILKDYIKDEDKNIRFNAALALEKVKKKGV